ncbi:hypothetical protein ACLOJK_015438 [Asimina triloba]
MVRITPMAASSSIQFSSFRPLSLPSFNPRRSSPPAVARLALSLSASNSGPSRRLALFHLGSGIFLPIFCKCLSSGRNFAFVPVRKGFFFRFDEMNLILVCIFVPDISVNTSSKTPYVDRPIGTREVVPQAQLFGIQAPRLLRVEGKNMEAGTPGRVAQASTAAGQENFLEWVKKDRRRLLHVVYQCLGMKLLRKRDIPEERYTNAFLGFGPEDSHFVVELTYNYGVDKYDLGTGFGHFGIAVEDVAKAVDLIKAKGGKVTREPGPVKGGKTVIAFIEDPDGYKFELLERWPTPEPLCQVMLRVGDLDRSINFYEKAFGMELLRKRDNPEYKKQFAFVLNV